MNYRKYLFIALFAYFGFFTSVAYAGELKEIVMKDGSVIIGEIVSLSNGVYTIKSGSLGAIKVKDSRIRSIRPAGEGGTADKGSGSPTRAQIDAIRTNMMGNEEVMKMILALQNDPDFKEILQDPSIMNAVNSGNLDALTTNPKFMKLINNSQIKGITEKVVK
ncbi:MAG: hypothetical protein V3S46_08075 [Nitrospinota bacterium]